MVHYYIATRYRLKNVKKIKEGENKVRAKNEYLFGSEI